MVNRVLWPVFGLAALLLGRLNLVRDTGGRAQACAVGVTTLTPCSLSDTIVMARGGRASFVLGNTGTVDHNYQVRCAFTSPVTACHLENSSVTVSGGGTQVVTVSYSASSQQATGTVSLIIDGGGSDQLSGAVSVTVVERAP